jgi:pimeloyl-ACP methyl ester carboxylesterase
MGQDNATPAQFEAAAAKYWSKGFGAAGKSMIGNITQLIPDATSYPVHYPASWSGCSSEDKGVADIVREITAQAKACPQQKFVLGGHSQGGVVTLRAIPKIPAEVFSKVIAVTMVGSPNCPAEFKAKCRSYCNAGDSVRKQSSGIRITYILIKMTDLCRRHH